MVDDRRGQTADVHLNIALLDPLKDVVAQAVDELGRRGVLWRARRDDREQACVPGLVDPQFADEGDPGLGAQPVGERGELLLRPGTR